MSAASTDQAFPAAARPGPLGFIAIYLVFAAVAARTLSVEGIRSQLSLYLVVELVFLVLYSMAFIFNHLPVWLYHFYFAVQSALVYWLIARYPEFDFLILLFLLLSAQAPLVFTGRTLWSWVGIFVAISGGSLIYFLGLARGLSLSLTTIAGDLVVPAFILLNHENEIARRRSQTLLGELQEANRRLQLYASQVEDLAVVQERNRLARQLHDSVTQLMFGISLTCRSAQMMLERDPARLPEQLERLQAMTSEALAQLRSLIARLRPPEEA